MAEFNIPNGEGQVRQRNVGDISGEIWASKNIDLTTSPGKVKLARPAQQIMTAANLANDGVEGIAYFNNKVHVLTDNNLYSDNTPYDSYSLQDSGPDEGQDLEVAFGLLLVAEDTDIASYTGSFYTATYWTSTLSGAALTTGVPHILQVHRLQGQETISVTDNNSIRYYNPTAGHTQIELDDDFVACCQAAGLNRGWIGTYTETQSEAFVYEWQVGQSQYTAAYPTGSKAVLAMEVFDNTPFIVTERGEIKRFNGVGFTTVATLPIFNEVAFLDGVETGLIQANNTSRPVHPKGMKRWADSILIFFNTDDVSNTRINGRSPAGVWEFTPSTGSLTHRYSLAGATDSERSGPVMVINDRNSRVYFGGNINPVSASTGEEGLYRENLTANTSNYGYFVTTEMHSDNFEDVFNSVIISALQDENDKIVVKYRASKSLDLPISADIEWTSSTTFTTTADLSNVSQGDEVEITSDTGAGRCVHISALDKTASTAQVTVDEAVGSNGDEARVLIDNWIKLEEYDSEQSVKRIGVNLQDTKAQFKVYLVGKNGNPEISRMLVKSTSKLPNK